MRIAFIDVTATVSYGGVQTAVWNLARVLAEAGHEVTVFGGDGPLRPLGDGSGVEVSTFAFTPRERVLDLGSRFTRIVERWTFARHARRTVAAGGFDWAILTKPFDFVWPELMPNGSRTRFCFMSGGTDFFTGDRRLARRVDAFVACSHFNAWQISTRYKRYPAVIYNGVDTRRFARTDDTASERRALGAAADDVVLAFAGRLVGWKGMHVAIEALADARVAALPLRLVIVGDGPERERLAARADALGVSARVDFRPPMPQADVARLYGAADIGLFPSIGDEAFGITLAEAMSCQCAVLASHVGGMPEVVGNEGTAGRLVVAGRPRQWAEAIAELAVDAPLRRRLGVAARRRIESTFTWQHSAARLLHALAEPR
jgi:glycosyltransferase involved in cell wall biosynthesis